MRTAAPFAFDESFASTGIGLDISFIRFTMNRFYVGLGLPTVSVIYASLEVWTDYPVFIQFIWKKDVSTDINVFFFFFFIIWKKMWKHMRPFTFTIVYRKTVHLEDLFLTL